MNIAKLFGLLIGFGLLLNQYSVAQYYIPAYAVEVQNFPQNYQLYPRSLLTNQAMIPIIGELSGSPAYTAIRLKVYRNDVLQDSRLLPLVNLMDKQGFSDSLLIPAELANYTIELYGYSAATGNVLLRKASQVVAGDVLMLTGQSNAESMQREGDANIANATYRPFVRVFGSGIDASSPLQWFVGDGNGGRTVNGNTGQLGMVIAAQLVKQWHLPIALMNGAHGGQPIEFFQRPIDPYTIYDLASNYGRLRYRMMASGLKANVRAILYYQGERNAKLGVSTTYYKSQLDTLYQSWKSDYVSSQKLFVFQIRQGCGSTVTNVLNVNQAQKEFVEDHSNEVRLISTANSTQFSDNCHFPYAEGYDLFGKRAFWLINSDLYGQSANINATSPYPNQADLLNTTQLTLTLKEALASYSLKGNFATDMRLEGTASYTITTLSLSQNVLTINFSKSPANGSAPTGITVMGHQGGASPALINANNIGLINFYNLPISNLIGNARFSALEPEESPFLFPNPASDQVEVRLPTGYDQARLGILTSSGKEISIPEQALDQARLLNVSGLPTGLYLVQVTSLTMPVYTLKFQKR